MMSATEYGIGIVKNRFALNGIEEEVDPLELLKRHELEREARKKSKVTEKVMKTKETAKPKSLKSVQEFHSKPPTEVVAQKVDLKNTKKDIEVLKKHVTIVENNKYYSENTTDFDEYDDKTDTERRDYNAGSVFEGESVERGRNNRRGLPRGVFVRGGGRGGWRGHQRSMFDSRGKREYDRQSGSDKTGIKPIDKREGSGAHNWGNPRYDIDSLLTPYSTEETWISEKVEDEPRVETNETVNEEETETSVDNIVEDEERKELTLDEWKALKTPRKKPTYNIRQAGEGEDLSHWKKMYALQKKNENEEEEEYEFGEYPQRVGKQKLLDIDIHFKDTRNTGVGRGRGFGRGGGFQPGRGSGSDSPRQNLDANNRILLPAPKVDDEKDFPSLA